MRNSEGTADPGPDLSAVIQEVVNRPGWRARNSNALLITGDSTRTVESYDSSPATAPLLYVKYNYNQHSENAPPIANFESSVEDLTVQITDHSIDNDGSIIGWSWNFGDGNVSTARDPIHRYSATGTYRIKLTVTDDGSANASVSSFVTMSESDNVAPSITAPADVSVDATGVDHTGRSRNTYRY